MPYSDQSKEYLKQLLQIYRRIVTIGTNNGPDYVNVTGNVGSITDKISNTIPTTTGAYSSGDNIGGIITCSGALRISGGTAIIQDISIWDLSNQKSNITIHFWNASPSGTYTDNAAEVIAGDQAKYLGMYNVTTADYVTVGAIATANLDYVGIVLKGISTSADIYYTIVTTSTPTYAANALIVKLGILQN